MRPSGFSIIALTILGGAMLGLALAGDIKLSQQNTVPAFLAGVGLQAESEGMFRNLAQQCHEKDDGNGDTHQ